MHPHPSLSRQQDCSFSATYVDGWNLKAHAPNLFESFVALHESQTLRVTLKKESHYIGLFPCLPSTVGASPNPMLHMRGFLSVVFAWVACEFKIKSLLVPLRFLGSLGVTLPHVTPSVAMIQFDCLHSGMFKL